jgi:hypothetical protein
LLLLELFISNQGAKLKPFFIYRIKETIKLYKYGKY